MGGRLIATDDQGKIIRIEDAARLAAESISLDLKLGESLSESNRKAIANTLAS